MSNILNTLKAERDKLDKAISILEGAKAYTGKKRGRKPGKKAKKAKGKRTMSAAARKLISKAQKARWAKKKKEAKKQAAAPVPVSA